MFPKNYHLYYYTCFQTVPKCTSVLIIRIINICNMIMSTCMCKTPNL